MSEKYSLVGTNTSSQGSFGSSLSSNSTSVASFKDGSWWTEEEARLYNSWAGTSDQYEKSRVNPYFDYFFCGQDIKIKIDGLNDDDFLPIYSFGYAIQQEKTPLYGFASYTYDAMLRGTRIISGMFSLIVTEPFLLTTKISESAAIRARTSQARSGAYALRHLDGDIANIQRYWRRNYDSALGAGDKHLFSIHPPFNFLIKYGMQDTSVHTRAPTATARANEVRQNFKSNGPMWTDTNERLYDTGSSNGVPNGGKILLENIELTSKSIEYDSSGDPILETYGFIARDERIVDEPYTMNVSKTAYPQSTGSDPTTPAPSTGGGAGTVRAM